MNILIIGGLGYIGSELVKRFESGAANVTVLDNNLFNSQFVPFNATLDKRSFIDVPLDYYDYFDHIILACDIDIDCFYTAENFDGYLFNYKNKLLDLFNLNEGKKVYWITSHSDENTARGEFFYPIIEKIISSAADKFFHIIPCPVLYGPSERMRTDTYVNKCIKDFIQYQKSFLYDNPFEIVEFLHLDEFTRMMVNRVLGKDYKDSQCYALPKMHIGHILQSLFGEQCQLLISEEVKYNIPVKCNLRFDGYREMEKAVNDFRTAIEQRKYMYMLEELSDNELMINNAISSYNFVKKLI